MVNQNEVSLLSLCYINTIDNLNRLTVNIRELKRNINNMEENLNEILKKFNINNMDELVQLDTRVQNLVDILNS
jgi:hypothetical protein